MGPGMIVLIIVLVLAVIMLARSATVIHQAEKGLVERFGRFKETLATIRCPVLLVHGAEDAIVSAASARWAHAQRPDWRLEIIPGVGHVPQVEVPSQFVQLVEDFLTPG